jgi:rare lipoprotein A
MNLVRALARFGAIFAIASAPVCAQSQVAPATSDTGVQTGIATVYAMDMRDKPTASGVPYDPARMTAAHRSLPLGTRVKVINLATQQSVAVTINDRWGGGQGRIINLSERAAREVGFGSAGTINVRIELIEIGDGAASGGPASAGEVQPAESARLVPDRVRAADRSPAERKRSCENEGEILGLTGELLEHHIRNCLNRPGER